MIKQFQAIIGVIPTVLAAGVATPAGAENVLRWTSAVEALTFDPIRSIMPRRSTRTAKSMSRWSTSTPALR
jgi:hypothetical protein